MDSKGYWHNRPSPVIDALRDELSAIRESPDGRARSNDRPRFIIELEVGSTVEVTRGDDKLLAIFEGAEKNKVTLRPIDEAGKTRPYLELAEQVQLSNGSDPGVKAQVWDNRNGKLILRTLPAFG